ncbi:MAG: hypothetical protein LBP31_02975 [Holosporales bacterium]|jgi:light-regulated signal transduction histidine kinase (bacteriophytochrome)|nr:hypothetical protein [Holosporales bacterium]
MATVIKDENAFSIYESKSYTYLTKHFPALEEVINEIVEKRSPGYRRIESLNVYSCSITDSKQTAKAFCFVISQPDFLLKRWHDMQEPLRSVFNFLQLLGRQDSVKSDKEAFQYVTYAMENIKKLKNWISDFLSISKLQRIDSDSKTRLKDVIHEIQLLLRYQIDNRDCIINVDDTIPPILCTKPELLSVFKNLIENSLKHAIVEGSLVINIYKAETKTDDRFVTLIFEDNGASVSSSNDGLGISISMEIVRSHNGLIKNISDGEGYYRYEIKLPI